MNFFSRKKNDIILVFAQNIDCWYTLEPPRRGELVQTRTHNLCFGANIREIGKPLQPKCWYKKVGYKGVYITQTCFPDAILTGHSGQVVRRTN